MLPPSWTALPSRYPTPLGCHRALDWAPWVIQKFPLAMCFTHGNVFVSMLFSQFLPRSSSPSCVQKSVFYAGISTEVKVIVAQSCPTLCDPMDYSQPGSSVHGIFQAWILECVAITPSRGISWPRDWTCISCTGRQILYHCATWEALSCNISAC